jgi:hypothetical protein
MSEEHVPPVTCSLPFTPDLPRLIVAQLAPVELLPDLRSWLCPYYFSNIWVGGQNLLECLSESCELWSCINFLEEFLHNWSARVSETQKLVVVSVLVSATHSEAKSLIAYRHVPSPILSHHLLCLNLSFRELLNKILGKSLAPQPRINLLLLALIRREL